MTDPSKPFDPAAGYAEMQSMLSNWTGMWRAMMPPFTLGRYETADPLVQEIGILSTMHNMASMLQNPAKLKAQINEEIVARAKLLAERNA